jgi:hypothetical protein
VDTGSLQTPPVGCSPPATYLAVQTLVCRRTQSLDQVVYLCETVDTVALSERAAESMRFQRLKSDDEHPLQRDYNMLGSKLSLLGEESSERSLIEAMIKETALPQLDGFSLQLREVRYTCAFGYLK